MRDQGPHSGGAFFVFLTCLWSLMDVVSIFTISASSRWEDNAAAWVEEARKAGHEATQVPGEAANNNCPVVLVGGDHYVLKRHQESDGILVSVGYRAVKEDRGWVPVDNTPAPVIRRTYRMGA